MTGCEFATLPDPCAAFFTWQGHLHAGEYLWIDIRKKLRRLSSVGSHLLKKLRSDRPYQFILSGLVCKPFVLKLDRQRIAARFRKRVQKGPHKGDDRFGVLHVHHVAQIQTMKRRLWAN
jgi:hypothetical protein